MKQNKGKQFHMNIKNKLKQRLSTILIVLANYTNKEERTYITVLALHLLKTSTRELKLLPGTKSRIT